jgi:hypothetical protein
MRTRAPAADSALFLPNTFSAGSGLVELRLGRVPHVSLAWRQTLSWRDVALNNDVQAVASVYQP